MHTVPSDTKIVGQAGSRCWWRMSSLLHAYAPPTLDARPAVDVDDAWQICCMRARLQLWTRVIFHVDKYHSTSLSLFFLTFHFSELLLLRYLKSRTYLLFLVFAAIQALLLTSFLPESQAFGTRSFNIQLQNCYKFWFLSAACHRGRGQNLIWWARSSPHPHIFSAIVPSSLGSFIWNTILSSSHSRPGPIESPSFDSLSSASFLPDHSISLTHSSESVRLCPFPALIFITMILVRYIVDRLD